MPYGYTGQNLINQTVKNSGVFSISDVADLEKQGKFGGSLELIEELNPNGVQFIDTSELPTNYDVFKVDFNISVSTGTANVHHCQFYESDVLETASVYQYAVQYGTTGGTFGEAKTTAFTNMYFYNFGDNGSTGYIYFYNLRNSSKHSFYTFHCTNFDGAFGYGAGMLPQASDVNKIRFKCSSASQTLNSPSSYKIYGIKQL